MKPVYINHHHEVLIETYLNTVYDTIQSVVREKDKRDDFMDVVDVILEYHNNYGNDRDAGNYRDFLMIIPLNISMMVTGFLAGYEDSSNASMIRVHRELLGQFALRVIEDISKIETVDD